MTDSIQVEHDLRQPFIKLGSQPTRTHPDIDLGMQDGVFKLNNKLGTLDGC